MSDDNIGSVSSSVLNAAMDAEQAATALNQAATESDVMSAAITMIVQQSEEIADQAAGLADTVVNDMIGPISREAQENVAKAQAKLQQALSGTDRPDAKQLLELAAVLLRDVEALPTTTVLQEKLQEAARQLLAAKESLGQAEQLCVSAMTEAKRLSGVAKKVSDDSQAVASHL